MKNWIFHSFQVIATLYFQSATFEIKNHRFKQLLRSKKFKVFKNSFKTFWSFGVNGLLATFLEWDAILLKSLPTLPHPANIWHCASVNLHF